MKVLRNITLSPARSDARSRSLNLWDLVGIVVLPVLVQLVVWTCTPLTENSGGFDSDGRYYGAMAGEPSLDYQRFTQRAPYCWRVLTPFLAAQLPFSTLANFKVLAFLSNWMSLALLYGILRRSGFGGLPSVVGILLYAGVFWSVKFSFYSPAYVDFQTQTLLLAILFLNECARWALIPFLLALAACQKESLVLYGVVPLFSFARQAIGASGWRAWLPPAGFALALFLPAALALVVLHGRIHPVNSFSITHGFDEALRRARSGGYGFVLLASSGSGMGILPLVLICGWRGAWRFARERPQWLVALLLSTLLLMGGSDKSRLFLYALPSLVVLSMPLLQSLVEASSPGRWAWLAATLSLHFYLGHHLEPMGTFDQYLARMVPEYAPTLATSLWRLGAVAGAWLVVTLVTARCSGVGGRGLPCS